MPKYRLRDTDQSIAFPTHLPNWPSLTLSGTQLMSWFSSPMRSRNSVTRTNHDETAL